MSEVNIHSYVKNTMAFSMSTRSEIKLLRERELIPVFFSRETSKIFSRTAILCGIGPKIGVVVSPWHQTKSQRAGNSRAGEEVQKI